MSNQAEGTISYDGTTAAALQALGGLILPGAVGSVILFIMTRYGKIKSFRTTVMLFLGTLFGSCFKAIRKTDLEALNL